MTILIFSTTTVAWSAPAFPVTEVGAQNSSRFSSFDHFSIPSKLGKLDHLRTAQGPAIVHIQTAHGNFEAQKNIQALLHHLNKTLGIKTVLVEGAVAKLDPKILEFFPQNKTLNRKANDYLTKKALVHGAELYLLDEKNASAYGIEDLAAYKSNEKAFIEVLKQKEQTGKFLKSMDESIARLSSHYLNDTLKGFMRAQEAYALEHMSFGEWTKVLRVRAKKYGWDLSDPGYQAEWPMLVRLYVTTDLAEKFDASKFESERTEFLKAVKPYLTRAQSRIHGKWTAAKNIYEYIEKVLGTPIHEIPLSGAESESLVEDMVRYLPRDFAHGKYPQVKNYLGQWLLSTELEAGALMAEVERLKGKLLERMSKTDEEKALVALLSDYQLLEKLFELKLTDSEYNSMTVSSTQDGRAQYDRTRDGITQNGEKESAVVIPSESRQGREESRDQIPPLLAWVQSVGMTESKKEKAGSTTSNGLTARNDRERSAVAQAMVPSSIASRFTSLNKDNRVKDVKFENLAKIDDLFNKAMSFYGFAKKRDEIMMKRIEERIGELKTDRVAVVTGGFHAEPFKAYFESKGYTYARLTPRITKADESGTQAYIRSIFSQAGELAAAKAGTMEYASRADAVISPNGRAELRAIIQPLAVGRLAISPKPRAELRAAEQAIEAFQQEYELNKEYGIRSAPVMVILNMLESADIVRDVEALGTLVEWLIGKPEVLQMMLSDHSIGKLLALHHAVKKSLLHRKGQSTTEIRQHEVDFFMGRLLHRYFRTLKTSMGTRVELIKETETIMKQRTGRGDWAMTFDTEYIDDGYQYRPEDLESLRVLEERIFAMEREREAATAETHRASDGAKIRSAAALLDQIVPLEGPIPEFTALSLGDRAAVIDLVLTGLDKWNLIYRLLLNERFSNEDLDREKILKGVRRTPEGLYLPAEYSMTAVEFIARHLRLDFVHHEYLQHRLFGRLVDGHFESGGEHGYQPIDETIVERARILAEAKFGAETERASEYISKYDFLRLMNLELEMIRETTAAGEYMKDYLLKRLRNFRIELTLLQNEAAEIPAEFPMRDALAVRRPYFQTMNDAHRIRYLRMLAELWRTVFEELVKDEAFGQLMVHQAKPSLDTFSTPLLMPNITFERYMEIVLKKTQPAAVSGAAAPASAGAPSSAPPPTTVTQAFDVISILLREHPELAERFKEKRPPAPPSSPAKTIPPTVSQAVKNAAILKGETGSVSKAANGPGTQGRAEVRTTGGESVKLPYDQFGDMFRKWWVHGDADQLEGMSRIIAGLDGRYGNPIQALGARIIQETGSFGDRELERSFYTSLYFVSPQLLGSDVDFLSDFGVDQTVEDLIQGYMLAHQISVEVLLDALRQDPHAFLRFISAVLVAQMEGHGFDSITAEAVYIDEQAKQVGAVLATLLPPAEISRAELREGPGETLEVQAETTIADFIRDTVSGLFDVKTEIFTLFVTGPVRLAGGLAIRAQEEEYYFATFNYEDFVAEWVEINMTLLPGATVRVLRRALARTKDARAEVRNSTVLVEAANRLFAGKVLGLFENFDSEYEGEGARGWLWGPAIFIAVKFVPGETTAVQYTGATQKNNIHEIPIVLGPNAQPQDVKTMVDEVLWKMAGDGLSTRFIPFGDPYLAKRRSPKVSAPGISAAELNSDAFWAQLEKSPPSVPRAEARVGGEPIEDRTLFLFLPGMEHARVMAPVTDHFFFILEGRTYVFRMLSPETVPWNAEALARVERLPSTPMLFEFGEVDAAGKMTGATPEFFIQHGDGTELRSPEERILQTGDGFYLNGADGEKIKILEVRLGFPVLVKAGDSQVAVSKNALVYLFHQGGQVLFFHSAGRRPKGDVASGKTNRSEAREIQPRGKPRGSAAHAKASKEGSLLLKRAYKEFFEDKETLVRFLAELAAYELKAMGFRDFEFQFDFNPKTSRPVKLRFGKKPPVDFQPWEEAPHEDGIGRTTVYRYPWPQFDEFLLPGSRAPMIRGMVPYLAQKVREAGARRPLTQDKVKKLRRTAQKLVKEGLARIRAKYSLRNGVFRLFSPNDDKKPVAYLGITKRLSLRMVEARPFKFDMRTVYFPFWPWDPPAERVTLVKDFQPYINDWEIPLWVVLNPDFSRWFMETTKESLLEMIDSRELSEAVDRAEARDTANEAEYSGNVQILRKLTADAKDFFVLVRNAGGSGITPEDNRNYYRRLERSFLETVIKTSKEDIQDLERLQLELEREATYMAFEFARKAYIVRSLDVCRRYLKEQIDRLKEQQMPGIEGGQAGSARAETRGTNSRATEKFNKLFPGKKTRAKRAPELSAEEKSRLVKTLPEMIRVNGGIGRVTRKIRIMRDAVIVPFWVGYSHSPGIYYGLVLRRPDMKPMAVAYYHGEAFHDFVRLVISNASKRRLKFAYSTGYRHLHPVRIEQHEITMDLENGEFLPENTFLNERGKLSPVTMIRFKKGEGKGRVVEKKISLPVLGGVSSLPRYLRAEVRLSPEIQQELDTKPADKIKWVPVVLGLGLSAGLAIEIANHWTWPNVGKDITLAGLFEAINTDPANFMLLLKHQYHREADGEVPPEEFLVRLITQVRSTNPQGTTAARLLKTNFLEAFGVQPGFLLDAMDQFKRSNSDIRANPLWESPQSLPLEDFLKAHQRDIDALPSWNLNVPAEQLRMLRFKELLWRLQSSIHAEVRGHETRKAPVAENISDTEDDSITEVPAQRTLMGSFWRSVLVFMPPTAIASVLLFPVCNFLIKKGWPELLAVPAAVFAGFWAVWFATVVILAIVGSIRFVAAGGRWSDLRAYFTEMGKVRREFSSPLPQDRGEETPSDFQSAPDNRAEVRTGSVEPANIADIRKVASLYKAMWGPEAVELYLRGEMGLPFAATVIHNKWQDGNWPFGEALAEIAASRVALDHQVFDRAHFDQLKAALKFFWANTRSQQENARALLSEIPGIDPQKVLAQAGKLMAEEFRGLTSDGKVHIQMAILSAGRPERLIPYVMEENRRAAAGEDSSPPFPSEGRAELRSDYEPIRDERYGDDGMTPLIEGLSARSPTPRLRAGDEFAAAEKIKNLRPGTVFWARSDSAENFELSKGGFGSSRGAEIPGFPNALEAVQFVWRAIQFKNFFDPSELDPDDVQGVRPGESVYLYEFDGEKWNHEPSDPSRRQVLKRVNVTTRIYGEQILRIFRYDIAGKKFDLVHSNPSIKGAMSIEKKTPHSKKKNRAEARVASQRALVRTQGTRAELRAAKKPKKAAVKQEGIILESFGETLLLDFIQFEVLSRLGSPAAGFTIYVTGSLRIPDGLRSKATKVSDYPFDFPSGFSRGSTGELDGYTLLSGAKVRVIPRAEIRWDLKRWLAVGAASAAIFTGWGFAIAWMGLTVGSLVTISVLVLMMLGIWDYSRDHPREKEVSTLGGPMKVGPALEYLAIKKWSGVAMLLHALAGGGTAVAVTALFIGQRTTLYQWLSATIRQEAPFVTETYLTDVSLVAALWFWFFATFSVIMVGENLADMAVKRLIRREFDGKPKGPARPAGGRAEVRGWLPARMLERGEAGGEKRERGFNGRNVGFYFFQTVLDALQATAGVLQAFAKNAELTLKIFQDHRELSFSRIIRSFSGRLHRQSPALVSSAVTRALRDGMATRMTSLMVMRSALTWIMSVFNSLTSFLTVLRSSAMTEISLLKDSIRVPTSVLVKELESFLRSMAIPLFDGERTLAGETGKVNINKPHKFNAYIAISPLLLAQSLLPEPDEIEWLIRTVNWGLFLGALVWLIVTVMNKKRDDQQMPAKPYDPAQAAAEEAERQERARPKRAAELVAKLTPPTSGTTVSDIPIRSQEPAVSATSAQPAVDGPPAGFVLPPVWTPVQQPVASSVPNVAPAQPGPEKEIVLPPPFKSDIPPPRAETRKLDPYFFAVVGLLSGWVVGAVLPLGALTLGQRIIVMGGVVGLLGLCIDLTRFALAVLRAAWREERLLHEVLIPELNQLLDRVSEKMGRTAALQRRTLEAISNAAIDRRVREAILETRRMSAIQTLRKIAHENVIRFPGPAKAPAKVYRTPAYLSALYFRSQLQSKDWIRHLKQAEAFIRKVSRAESRNVPLEIGKLLWRLWDIQDTWRGLSTAQHHGTREEYAAIRLAIGKRIAEVYELLKTVPWQGGIPRMLSAGDIVLRRENGQTVFTVIVRIKESSEMDGVYFQGTEDGAEFHTVQPRLDHLMKESMGLLDPVALPQLDRALAGLRRHVDAFDVLLRRAQGRAEVRGEVFDPEMAELLGRQAEIAATIQKMIKDGHVPARGDHSTIWASIWQTAQEEGAAVSARIAQLKAAKRFRAAASGTDEPASPDAGIGRAEARTKWTPEEKELIRNEVAPALAKIITQQFENGQRMIEAVSAQVLMPPQYAYDSFVFEKVRKLHGTALTGSGIDPNELWAGRVQVAIYRVALELFLRKLNEAVNENRRAEMRAALSKDFVIAEDILKEAAAATVHAWFFQMRSRSIEELLAGQAQRAGVPPSERPTFRKFRLLTVKEAGPERSGIQPWPAVEGEEGWKKLETLLGRLQENVPYRIVLRWAYQAGIYDLEIAPVAASTEKGAVTAGRKEVPAAERPVRLVESAVQYYGKLAVQEFSERKIGALRLDGPRNGGELTLVAALERAGAIRVRVSRDARDMAKLSVVLASEKGGWEYAVTDKENKSTVLLALQDALRRLSVEPLRDRQLAEGFLGTAVSDLIAPRERAEARSETARAELREGATAPAAEAPFVDRFIAEEQQLRGFLGGLHQKAIADLGISAAMAPVFFEVVILYYLRAFYYSEKTDKDFEVLDGHERGAFLRDLFARLNNRLLYDLGILTTIYETLTLRPILKTAAVIPALAGYFEQIRDVLNRQILRSGKYYLSEVIERYRKMPAYAREAALERQRGAEGAQVPIENILDWVLSTGGVTTEDPRPFRNLVFWLLGAMRKAKFTFTIRDWMKGFDRKRLSGEPGVPASDPRFAERIVIIHNDLGASVPHPHQQLFFLPADFIPESKVGVERFAEDHPERVKWYVDDRGPHGSFRMGELFGWPVPTMIIEGEDYARMAQGVRGLTQKILAEGLRFNVLQGAYVDPQGIMRPRFFVYARQDGERSLRPNPSKLGNMWATFEISGGLIVPDLEKFKGLTIKDTLQAYRDTASPRRFYEILDLPAEEIVVPPELPAEVMARYIDVFYVPGRKDSKRLGGIQGAKPGGDFLHVYHWAKVERGLPLNSRFTLVPNYIPFAPHGMVIFDRNTGEQDLSLEAIENMLRFWSNMLGRDAVRVSAQGETPRPEGPARPAGGPARPAGGRAEVRDQADLAGDFMAVPSELKDAIPPVRAEAIPYKPVVFSAKTAGEVSEKTEVMRGSQAEVLRWLDQVIWIHLNGKADPAVEADIREAGHKLEGMRQEVKDFPGASERTFTVYQRPIGRTDVEYSFEAFPQAEMSRAGLNLPYGEETGQFRGEESLRAELRQGDLVAEAREAFKVRAEEAVRQALADLSERQPLTEDMRQYLTWAGSEENVARIARFYMFDLYRLLQQKMKEMPARGQVRLGWLALVELFDFVRGKVSFDPYADGESLLISVFSEWYQQAWTGTLEKPGVEGFGDLLMENPERDERITVNNDHVVFKQALRRLLEVMPGRAEVRGNFLKSGFRSGKVFALTVAGIAAGAVVGYPDTVLMAAWMLSVGFVGAVADLLRADLSRKNQAIERRKLEEARQHIAADRLHREMLKALEPEVEKILRGSRETAENGQGVFRGFRDSALEWVARQKTKGRISEENLIALEGAVLAAQPDAVITVTRWPRGIYGVQAASRRAEARGASQRAEVRAGEEEEEAPVPARVPLPVSDISKELVRFVILNYREGIAPLDLRLAMEGLMIVAGIEPREISEPTEFDPVVVFRETGNLRQEIAAELVRLGYTGGEVTNILFRTTELLEKVRDRKKPLLTEFDAWGVVAEGDRPEEVRRSAHEVVETILSYMVLNVFFKFQITPYTDAKGAMEKLRAEVQREMKIGRGAVDASRLINMPVIFDRPDVLIASEGREGVNRFDPAQYADGSPVRYRGAGAIPSKATVSQAVMLLLDDLHEGISRQDGVARWQDPRAAQGLAVAMSMAVQYLAQQKLSTAA
ncbi:MAG: hypothetical protein ACOY3K_01790 [Candidatus Omnitrophota bacterium]